MRQRRGGANDEEVRQNRIVTHIEQLDIRRFVLFADFHAASCDFFRVLLQIHSTLLSGIDVVVMYVLRNGLRYIFLRRQMLCNRVANGR